MTKKKLIVLVLAILVIATAAALIRHKRASIEARRPPEPLAIVVGEATLGAGPVQLTRAVSADVIAVREAVVTSRITGYVVDLPLFEADSFRRGALLAGLAMLPGGDNGRGNSLERDWAAAGSTLAAAQERLARTRRLFTNGAATQEQLEADEAAARAAEAQRTAASENLSNVTLTAPFDGVVSARLVSPGDLATPGKPLLKVIDPAAGLRLLVTLPPDIAPSALTAGGRTFPLRPWPEATAQGVRRFEARAHDGFVPGTRVDSRVTIFNAPGAVRIPRSCVMTGDGRSVRVLQLDAQEGVRPLDAAVTAEGEEGLASLDARLPGIRIACASADILMRLAAGAPFRIAAE